MIFVHDDGTSFPDRRPAYPIKVHLHKHFKDLFSLMPWPAIPFCDAVSRVRIERQFLGHRGHLMQSLFVVDYTVKVLQCKDLNILYDSEAPGYPFNEGKIDFLRAKDDATTKKPFLKMLLAFPKCNNIILGKKMCYDFYL